MVTVPALYVTSKRFSQWVSVTSQERLDLRFSVLAVKKSIFQNAELIMSMGLALALVSHMPF
jgi:hypothetical protein